MQQKRTRSSRPKLFQCRGYGDCNMIFTRSEHLARHARKHTGEKPFVCIVPECKKAFSRFDNMMQHTQTHRNSNHYNIVNSHPKDRHHKDGPGDNTRSNTRAQTRQTPHKKSTSTAAAATAACEQQQQQQQQQTDTKKKSCCDANNSYMNNELYIQTHGQQPSPSGLISPISLSSSSPRRQIFSYTSSTSSEEEDEEEEAVIHTPPLKRTRRLSVADLCNPTNDTVPFAPTTSIHNLTKDEFEALEGFGRFRHSPTVFFDPLKDLAHVSRY